MRVPASDVAAPHRPTLCPLIMYLRQQGVEEAEPGAFEQVLLELGERHERGHLESLGAYTDLSAVPPRTSVHSGRRRPSAIARTGKELRNHPDDKL